MFHRFTGGVTVRSGQEVVISYYARIALAIACRTLGRRGWSPQDRHDAATEAICSHWGKFDDDRYTEEEVVAAMAETIGEFRRIEGWVRRRTYHLPDFRLDEASEAAGLSLPNAQQITEARRLQELKEARLQVLADPITRRSVRPVTLLAMLTQQAPTLVGEREIEEALKASGHGRGIIRSAESFKARFGTLLNELLLAMERFPRRKQFPELSPRLAFLFRGPEGQDFEGAEPQQLTTYLNWYYQQRRRGLERLALVVA
jgi:hypothetical protein